MPRVLHIVWDEFEDDQSNVSHIGQGLMDDVEFVLYGDEFKLDKSRSTGRPIAFGLTESGETLAVVFEWVDEAAGVVYPVTAYLVE